MNKKFVLYSFVLAAALCASAAFAGGVFKPKNTSFKDIYNNYQAKAVTPTPWAGYYWAYADDGIAIGGKDSPATKYDKFYDQDTKATKWEKKFHSCREVEAGEMKEGCMAWWGHCDAWSAAAIKEPEPRKPVANGNTSFGVGDQKAYLTEIWMSGDCLFAGDTDKESVTNKRWVCNPKSKNYDIFWDVTPKDFFLIFTNYIGIQNEGLAIDRFTGDQVWNQPVVAYKILDIDPTKDIIKEETVNGKTVYPVKIGMSFYWANDGVDGDYLSETFDIQTADELIKKSEKFKLSYEMRTLYFTLFFDEPVKMEGRNKIASAGKIVGDGVWKNQEECKNLKVEELDDGHPDVIWKPTKLIKEGDANEFIDAEKVYKIIGGTSSGGGGGHPVDPVDPVDPGGGDDPLQVTKITLELAANSLPGTSPETVKLAVKKALDRANIKSVIYLRDISMDGRKKVLVQVTLPEPVTEKDLKDALNESGIEVMSIRQ